MTFETEYQPKKDELLTRIVKRHINEDTQLVQYEHLLANKLAEKGINIKPQIINTLVNRLDMMLREPVDYIFKTNAGNVIYSSEGPAGNLDEEAKIAYEERRLNGDLPEHCVVIRDIQRLHGAYTNLIAWSRAQSQEDEWLKYTIYGGLLQVASKEDLEHPEFYLEKVLARMKNGHLLSHNSELGQITTKDGKFETLSVGSMNSPAGHESPFRLTFHTVNNESKLQEQLPSVYYAIDHKVATDTDFISQVSIFAIQDEPIEGNVTPKELKILDTKDISELIISVDEKISKQLQLKADVRPFKTVQEIDELLRYYKLVEKTKELIVYLQEKRLYIKHNDYKQALQKRTENRRRYNKGLNGGGAHLISFFSAICVMKKQGYKRVNLETFVPFGLHVMHDKNDIDERNQIRTHMMSQLTKVFTIIVEATSMNWHEDGSRLVMDLSSWDGSLVLNRNRESYVLFELVDSILGTSADSK